jgi:hypothetical protein
MLPPYTETASMFRLEGKIRLKILKRVLFRKKKFMVKMFEK